MGDIDKKIKKKNHLTFDDIANGNDSIFIPEPVDGGNIPYREYKVNKIKEYKPKISPHDTSPQEEKNGELKKYMNQEENKEEDEKEPKEYKKKKEDEEDPENQ